MSFKNLPLLGTAEIIGALNLSPKQTAAAANLAHRVTQSAWRRRPPHKSGQTYEEFAAAVSACAWLTMFEVGALLILGRHHDARILTEASRSVHQAAHTGRRR
ncbi:hypothetical protein AW27_023070 [Streptomyces sp. PCS3-D2]|uniref:hypothetical protein n=1 Tax=Streptomyces sp. PCS3-D2 TaxID=1460244 RepID=UPI0004503DDC|nr:hypothetical protein [Streptomyces sp. PCS3-D2]WKV74127.1 hypothetical protein AW27_023070 [Streptomyces sp. PCS3-D2]